MQDAVLRMLERYSLKSANEAIRALREIVQECALLGLWRAKFFEHAAFYGGTALRILYGMERFSEDLDFTLLKPDPAFSLARYGDSLLEELQALGFDVHMNIRRKVAASSVESAFLKANTRTHLIQVGIPAGMTSQIPANQIIRINFEIDRDPPPLFTTESRYVLLPVPFAVKVCALPDLFAGKMHALLFRRWRNRVKGRDWYDFVWFVSYYPSLHVAHLEERMRQTGQWSHQEHLTGDRLKSLLYQVIAQIDIGKAQEEVRPFLRDPSVVDIWSRDFFRALVERITFTLY